VNYARASIEAVSKLRAKICFEDFYGFDGIYEPVRTMSDNDYVPPIFIDSIFACADGGSIGFMFLDKNENIYDVKLNRSMDCRNTTNYNRLFFDGRKSPLSEGEELRFAESVIEFLQSHKDEIEDSQGNVINTVLTMIEIPQADRPQS